jgi:hypothetical protein
MAYQVALAQLGAARAKVSQMTAALAQAKDDLARGLADLGALGEQSRCSACGDVVAVFIFFG